MSAPALDAVFSGSYPAHACSPHAIACGASFQLYCILHDAHGPLRATKAEAERDACVVAAARLESHANWRSGVEAKLHAEQRSSRAPAPLPATVGEPSGEARTVGDLVARGITPSKPPSIADLLHRREHEVRSGHMGKAAPLNPPPGETVPARVRRTGVAMTLDEARALTEKYSEFITTAAPSSKCPRCEAWVPAGTAHVCGLAALNGVVS